MKDDDTTTSKIDGKNEGKDVVNNSTLQLPVEIIGVIAEHLIGEFAFRTVARLNRASKAVHRETLPILYESLFLEHFYGLPYYRSGGAPSKGLSYTKFAFTAELDPRKEEVAKLLPNVIMTMTLELAVGTRKANNCDVLVHRPISSATAFRIIETPTRRQFTGNWVAECDPAWRCEEEEEKPLVGPVEGIQDVLLKKGAFIYPALSIRNQLPISLNGSGLAQEYDDDDSQSYDEISHIAITALELMKLVCTERSTGGGGGEP